MLKQNKKYKAAGMTKNGATTLMLSYQCSVLIYNYKFCRVLSSISGLPRLTLYIDALFNKNVYTVVMY